ncbi:hypothetical protein SCA6_014575 [Theobroma cacao]|uniref:Uncharacterized protein LOC18613361 n=1 Tax=Theobroma cacao TaxID=3641 RepID=A0AB32VRF5_THECC|nr:PREDICTED: uncharacterized protein LOC18613361 [Theobroma cacao]
MGRRPLAQKLQRKATTSKPDIADPSGGVEKQPDSSNPSSEKELQFEKTNPQLETIEPQTKSADLSSVTKAKKHIAGTKLRRSGRLYSAGTPQDKDIDRIIEEMTLTESEKDEEPLNFEGGKLPEPTLTNKSLEEKVDYLLQQFEEQQKTIEELKLKVTIDSSPTGSPRAADTRYRNLYFGSQKKIEALTDENRQLSLKLEHALGKLEAYENGARVFSEGLDKLKDMILVTNLAKATERAVNLSSQAFTSVDAGAEAKTGAKRKRVLAGK